MISPSKEQLIELYYDQKLTLQEVADLFKTSKTTICRLLKKYRLEAVKTPRDKIAPDKDTLIALYSKGTCDSIAKHYGVHRVTVAKWLHSYEIPIRTALEVPSKEELLHLYEGMNKTINDIATIYDVNRNIISKWLKSYDIKIRLFNVSDKKPEAETLKKYYETDKLTLKQIASIYNVSRQTVERWAHDYGIDIDSNVRRYYHLKAVPLTRLQKEFIVGTLLGDGHIAGIGKKKNSKRLTMTHCEKQLDYLLWKKNILGNLVNTISRYEQKSRNSISWRFASITHHEFSLFHKMFYEGTKKVVKEEIASYLTPLAMAVWVMDDGWKNHCNIRISSESFSKAENELLVKIIKLNFNINCKVGTYVRNCKEYYYISFNKRNSILLSNLIKDYVLDSMSYKLIDCSSTTECENSAT